MDTGKVVRASSARAVGWRVWAVQERPEGVRLGSIIHETLWTPGLPVRAACSLDSSHVAPDASCGCGVHAARDPVDVFSYLHGRNEPRTICRILGEVMLLGQVVETERGWRASRAYPLRLYVRDARLADALASYGVPVLSPECAAAIATSSQRGSVGSPTSSSSVARTCSWRRAASG